MPIYEYRCERGHTFEAMQRMTDDPLTTCSTCDAPVERVFHPVAVHFKGSGFYTTDYGKKQAADAGDSTAKDDSKDSKDSSDSGSSDSGSSKEKPAAKSDSSSE